jgi:hypothetical protein
MEDVGIFYDHMVYFVAIWFILCLFGIFPRFDMLHIPRLICNLVIGIVSLSRFVQVRATRLGKFSPIG